MKMNETLRCTFGVQRNNPAINPIVPGIQNKLLCLFSFPQIKDLWVPQWQLHDPAELLLSTLEDGSGIDSLHVNVGR